MNGLSPAQAALTEAYEEAGLEGRIFDTAPIGRYHYEKRVDGLDMRTIVVDVYVLEVSRQLPAWPEKAERVTRWWRSADAAGLVAEPELARILSNLRMLLTAFGAAIVQPVS